MELKFEVRLTNEEANAAIRDYAQKYLPVIEGYHVEVDDLYAYSVKAYLVKDIEERVPVDDLVVPLPYVTVNP